MNKNIPKERLCCKYCWEELKAFRENKWTLIWQARGYNKAIDDFAGKLKTEYKNAVAEQLKLKHIEKESEE